jgi:hypothetical protein
MIIFTALLRNRSGRARGWLFRHYRTLRAPGRVKFGESVRGRGHLRDRQLRNAQKRSATDLQTLPRGARSHRHLLEGIWAPRKVVGITTIWTERKQLFADYLAADGQVAFLAALPWLGPITKFHLAKNFGGNFAKPNVHLTRLAGAEGTTASPLRTAGGGDRLPCRDHRPDSVASVSGQIVDSNNLEQLESS